MYMLGIIKMSLIPSSSKSSEFYSVCERLALDWPAFRLCLAKQMVLSIR